MHWFNTIFILGIVVWNLILTNSIKIYEEKEILGNVVGIEEEYLMAFGLEGAGYVYDDYPVYYLTYIKESDYEAAVEEAYSRHVQLLEAQDLINTIRKQIAVLYEQEGKAVDEVLKSEDYRRDNEEA